MRFAAAVSSWEIRPGVTREECLVRESARQSGEAISDGVSASGFRDTDNGVVRDADGKPAGS